MDKTDIIENLNYDYLKVIGSREYNIGIKKNTRRVADIRDLFFKVNRKIHLYNINDIGKNYNFTENDKEIMKKFILKNKKIVIYSSIVGKYDELQEPLYQSDNIDYVMFTDLSLKSNVWNINKIPKKILDINNPILINRYIKFHPFELFENKYNYSIYIDGNILVISDLSEMIGLVNKKYGIAFHNHYARDCVYDEAKYCMYNKKGNKESIKNLIKKYNSEGFPKHYGLLEAPIIISDLNSKISNEIQDDIYKELINNNTFRDQLSIPYVLWEKRIKPKEIATLGENIHYNYKVRSIRHS